MAVLSYTNNASVGVSARPYSLPSGGFGDTSIIARLLGYSSSDFDGAGSTDSLEPHWLLEIVIQVCPRACVSRVGVPRAGLP